MNINIQKLAPWNWLKDEQSAAVKHGTVANRAQGQNLGQSSGLGSLTNFYETGPLASLHRDIDRLFGDVFSAFQTFPTLGEQSLITDTMLRPNIDIAETTKAYTVSVEIPGVDEKDVKLELSDNMLTVSGTKKSESENKDKNFHRIERSYGTFQRMLTLPEDAVADAIDAQFKNGVLTITMPRKAIEKPKGSKVIDIKSAA